MPLWLWCMAPGSWIHGARKWLFGGQVYLGLAYRQTPRCQRAQEEDRSRMDPAPQRPTHQALHFLPLLRMACLFKEWIVIVTGALEGDSLWGRRTSYSTYHFGKLSCQSAGITQTTNSHWILQAGLVSSWFCPLGDFEKAVKRERAGYVHVLSTCRGLCWNLASSFHFQVSTLNYTIFPITVFLLLKLTGNPLTFLGQKKLFLKLYPTLIKLHNKNWNDKSWQLFRGCSWSDIYFRTDGQGFREVSLITGSLANSFF